MISGIPEKIVTANISYLYPNQRLVNKRLIITGGAKGIGLALTKNVCRKGLKFL